MSTAWEEQLSRTPGLYIRGHIHTETQTAGRLSLLNPAVLSPVLFLPQPFSGSSELPLRCPLPLAVRSPSSLPLNGALCGPVLSEKHDSELTDSSPEEHPLLGLCSLCSVTVSRLHQGGGSLTPYDRSHVPSFLSAL